MIKSYLKKIAKNNDNAMFFLKALQFIRNTTVFKIDGSKKKYPKVIQLPITYRCNSRCLMCNVWKMDTTDEAEILEFSEFMKDELFKKVQSVGINGGEPTLISNIDEYARIILTLPEIKSLNIISHGFNTNRALKAFEKIYTACRENSVSFHVSISLDGVGKIHDEVRQIPNGFSKTVSTIDELIKNQHKYCDSYDVACTVVKQNIDNLVELNEFSKVKGYKIKYRLGVSNKRIESDLLLEQYTVLSDKEYKQSAVEFFHYLMSNAKDINEKFKYFSIVYWLTKSNPKRLLGCIWKDEGITLDSRGELYYCAVESEKLGTLRNGKDSNIGTDVFFDKVNIEQRKSIIKNKCDSCIHDYGGQVKLKSLMIFVTYILNNRISMGIYKMKLMTGL
jgi:MoaA/NifB/PqqE/SkfB family radical SAM enzyme